VDACPLTENAGIIIAGGGPVGCAAALALSGAGQRVLLLESGETPRQDHRPLALSFGSRLILERLGVWPAIAGSATAIRNIHVSQRGGFGRVLLDADEAGLTALGYVVSYAALSAALFERATVSPAIDCRTGSEVIAWRAGMPAGVDVIGSQDLVESLPAQLLVIADGKGPPDSHGREWDYGQTAITARVVSKHPHRNTAYERFTSQGPMALLPDGDGWALVWTVSSTERDRLMSMDDQQFVSELQQAFGWRAGHFVAASNRAAYPLRARQAAQRTLAHTVLIGNAAQTLHPVAGQGFNLGLRDAWELGECAITCTAAIGSDTWLHAYEKRRAPDRRGGTLFTHNLVRLFSNDVPGLQVLRATGLTALACLPPLKNFLIRRMTFGPRG
jgi:2-octaprenyl-6-methoxyphenol hydroxylase